MILALSQGRGTWCCVPCNGRWQLYGYGSSEWPGDVQSCITFLHFAGCNFSQKFPQYLVGDCTKGFCY